MRVVGLSSSLHDGAAGIHLVSGSCPSGCYELPFSDAPAGSAAERIVWLESRVFADTGLSVGVFEVGGSFGVVMHSRDPDSPEPLIPDPAGVTLDG